MIKVDKVQLSFRVCERSGNLNLVLHVKPKQAITLKALHEVADVLGMKLVYGFIHQNESLEKMIEERAQKLAMEIVL